MDAIESLRGVREQYLKRYRAVLRAKREEGATCAAEVWVEPKVEPGGERPPHPLCCDIIIEGADGPGVAMVSDEPANGPLVATHRVDDLPVKIYATTWEAMAVWFCHPDPDWAAIDRWRKKWMDPERADAGDAAADPDGLTGVVHYLGRPTAEGGGHLYWIDFGSAPVEAVTELLGALAAMGATEIELGRSDGSDLPADVLAELRQPDLTVDQVTALAARLLERLAEVERVERVGEESLAAYVKETGRPQRIFLGNLHRLLLRTGIEGRPKEVNRFVRGQRESMVPQDAPDLSQLRLLVKDERFLENIRRQVPDMSPLVREHLAGDLWLVCVWDAPNGMRFATEDEPGRYELTVEQILERARANFLAERPPVELSKQGSLLVAQTHDCYDATLLIDSKWWEETAGRLKGEPLACVPARNIVLVGGAARAGAADEMRDAARRIEAGGDHLISNTILVRRAGAWQVYEEAEPGAAPSASPAAAPPATPNAKRPWWRFW